MSSGFGLSVRVNNLTHDVHDLSDAVTRLTLGLTGGTGIITQNIDLNNHTLEECGGISFNNASTLIGIDSETINYGSSKVILDSNIMENTGLTHNPLDAPLDCGLDKLTNVQSISMPNYLTGPERVGGPFTFCLFNGVPTALDSADASSVQQCMTVNQTSGKQQFLKFNGSTLENVGIVWFSNGYYLMPTSSGTDLQYNNNTILSTGNIETYALPNGPLSNNINLNNHGITGAAFVDTTTLNLNNVSITSDGNTNCYIGNTGNTILTSNITEDIDLNNHNITNINTLQFQKGDGDIYGKLSVDFTGQVLVETNNGISLNCVTYDSAGGGLVEFGDNNILATGIGFISNDNVYLTATRPTPADNPILTYGGDPVLVVSEGKAIECNNTIISDCGGIAFSNNLNVHLNYVNNGLYYGEDIVVTNSNIDNYALPVGPLSTNILMNNKNIQGASSIETTDLILDSNDIKVSNNVLVVNNVQSATNPMTQDLNLANYSISNLHSVNMNDTVTAGSVCEITLNNNNLVITNNSTAEVNTVLSYSESKIECDNNALVNPAAIYFNGNLGVPLNYNTNTSSLVYGEDTLVTTNNLETLVEPYIIEKLRYRVVVPAQTEVYAFSQLPSNTYGTVKGNAMVMYSAPVMGAEADYIGFLSANFTFAFAPNPSHSGEPMLVPDSSSVTDVVGADDGRLIYWALAFQTSTFVVPTMTFLIGDNGNGSPALPNPMTLTYTVLTL